MPVEAHDASAQATTTTGGGGSSTAPGAQPGTQAAPQQTQVSVADATSMVQQTQVSAADATSMARHDDDSKKSCWWHRDECLAAFEASLSAQDAAGDSSTSDRRHDVNERYLNLCKMMDERGAWECPRTPEEGGRSSPGPPVTFPRARFFIGVFGGPTLYWRLSLGPV